MRESFFAVVLIAAAACGGGKKAPAEPAPAPESKLVIAQPQEPAPAPPPAEPAPEPAEPPVVAAADSTGSPACDAYISTFDQIAVGCESKLPPETLAAMKQGRDAMRAAFHQWDTLDGPTRKATLDAAGPGCQQAVEALRQAADQLGCPVR